MTRTASLAFVLLLAGCNSGVTPQGDSCPAATQTFINAAPPRLGFVSDVAVPEAVGTVTSVTATELQMTVGSPPTALTFRFAGADLRDAFAVGDDVFTHAESKPNGWSRVEGKSFAAVYVDDNASFYAGSATGVPPSPIGGPTLSYGEQCSFDVQEDACHADIVRTALSVNATLGGKSVTVDAGETADLQGWKIYAGRSFKEAVASQDADCAVETGWEHQITLLSPPQP